MKVFILITEPKSGPKENALLCFDTIRVGFPTWEIHATLNDESTTTTSFYIAFTKKCEKAQVKPHFSQIRQHHAKWIEQALYIGNYNKPLVILDGDTIFWENCEGFTFPTLLAGYFVPFHHNEYSRCMTVSRLHTSFLWIKDPTRIEATLLEKCPDRHNLYLPFNPFLPHFTFMNDAMWFWDTCAELYQCLGGTAFEEKHLNCFDHLNSASFYPEMLERLSNREGFQKMHELAHTEPQKLRGLWKEIDLYYKGRGCV